VVSSVIAAWSDVSSVLSDSLPAVSTGVSVNTLQSIAGAVRGLNVGYFWMLVNCLTSAAYVRDLSIVETREVGSKTYCRFFPCAEESSRQGSRIGTLCFTIICSVFPSLPSSPSSQKTGALKTYIATCKCRLARKVAQGGADIYLVLPPHGISC